MTEDDKREMCKLRANGQTLKVIGKRFGISYERVRQIVGGLRHQLADPSTLYFAQVGEFVKIGIARNIKRRLDGFRLHCPYPVVLLGTIEGMNRPQEISLHRKFAHLHHWKEWYRADPELLDYISKCVESGGLTH